MNPLKIKKNQLIYQLWQNNGSLINSQFLVSISITLIFSGIIFLLNKKLFLYSGYAYSDMTHVADAGFLFFMIYLVRDILQKPNWANQMTDISLCFSTMLLIALLTNAIQLTPFSTIDWLLGQYEELPLVKAVVWTRSHQHIQYIFTHIYNLLGYCMIYCPIINIFFGNRAATHQYCRFMLLSSIIGFSFYFFFPSCGPASYFNADVFLEAQHANHIKFWLIHHGIMPESSIGGLIALPSFHVIWSWACCRIFCCMPKILYYSFFSYFFLTMLSCFFLGWHYSIDIIGSLIVIYLTERLIRPKLNSGLKDYRLKPLL